MKKILLLMLLGLLCPLFADQDTTIVQVFTYDDPSPEGWGANYFGLAEFPKDGRWEKILMVQTLKCDSRTKADTFACGEWDYIWETVVFVPTNSDTGDSVEEFQIGSFVTPYGLRLDLTEDGWEWVYDVTDYAPILKGLRRIKSGNNQELLDLKFVFIEGTPPRDPISVQNIWKSGNYKYKALADDSVLSSSEIIIPENAENAQIMARISGHGHNGPSNCCEWMNKTHSYYIGSWELVRWNVWKDCGNNPIYPQGGTWPFDRAGWCPGTKVDEFRYDISDFISSGDTFELDYSIEMYRDNEEFGGEFREAHQVFTYSKPNFKTDVRIEEIISPNSKDSYRRYNPNCGEPIIVVRNTGTNTVNSLFLLYSVNDTIPHSFTWHGQLGFMELDTIYLPAFDYSQIAEDSLFKVKIMRVNHFGAGSLKGNETGNADFMRTVLSSRIHSDEYEANNSMTSKIKPIPTLPDTFILEVQTNNLGRAAENTAFIFQADEPLYISAEYEDSTTYQDTISLFPGCYEFLFTDTGEDGQLVHWWNPDNMGVNGFVRFISLDGDTLKRFHPDFGQQIRFNFIAEQD